VTIEYVPVSDDGLLWSEQAGDGEPMVLLHGSVQDSRLWDGVFPALASASGHDWPQSPDLDAYAAANQGNDADRLAELELTVWASLGDQAPRYPTITTMVTENAKVRANVRKEHVRFVAETAVKHLDRVTAPTTVVVGEHDHPEIGVIACRLAEGIPGARLEIVAGADHYLPLRAPERLTEIILG
jgi:3-oxoadipate enol-lactonase